MIYRTNRQKYHTSQAGVTMLLAILVLSAITAISFSLATIVFIEIRTSGDVIRTEPTLYASQAITEEALFKVKRGALVTYTTNLNGIILDDPPPTLQFYSPSPLVKIVGSLATQQFQIVDPNNVFGGANYKKLIITFLNPGPGLSIDITMDQIDPLTGDRTAAFAGTALNTSTPWTVVLDRDMQYELNIHNPSTTESVTISIDTYGPDGVTRQGLPYIGQTVLDIVASYAGLTRKYEVKIPE